MNEICRSRQRLMRSLDDRLVPLIIFHPLLDRCGQPMPVLEDPLPYVRARGYFYYKFERLTPKYASPGRTARERTERVLLLPFALTPFSCASCAVGQPCALPAVQPGDWFLREGIRYSVTAVQDDARLYRTLVVSREGS